MTIGFGRKMSDISKNIRKSRSRASDPCRFGTDCVTAIVPIRNVPIDIERLARSEGDGGGPLPGRDRRRLWREYT
jgi:hypothetical protein